MFYARHTLTSCAICSLLGTFVLIQGCVTSRIEEFHQTNSDAALAEGESVVILTRRDHTTDETEKSFRECLHKQLVKGASGINVKQEKEFVDRMFPYFEPRLAPANPQALPKLLAKPGVVDQIAEIGVRYLIWIDGDTKTVDQGGSMSCALSPGGGGCLGMNWWERESSYEASIWDLKNAEVAGTISAEATGTSYMPALIIPIPLVARPGAAACKGLASQLRQFFAPQAGQG